MGLYRELPDDIQTVDAIIAGGGTAGCIVAARLAEADPNLSVLVVEAGPDGAGNPAVDYPAFFLSNLTPSATTTAFYKSQPSENLGGREIVIPTGAVLGGGSSINMMMYSRAQRDDWDSWKIPGWTADEMLPYLKKSETYHGPGSMDRHGSNGPIHVSSGTFIGKRCQDDFISAMNKVGWPEKEDLGSMDTCNGVQRAVRFISPDGKRQDTASRYLKPLLQDGVRPGLHVLVESQVVHVLFQGKKASGIVYQPKAEGAADRTVNARNMVIVSAGAFGTPAILERSGIGKPNIIRRAGIAEVVADVPGVGHQYDDHHLLLYPYKSNLNPDETIDGILNGSLNPTELIQNDAKILGWNAQDVTCKLRPTDKDVESLGPVFKEVWNEEFKDSPNKPLMMMALVNCFPGEPIGIPPGQYFGISTFTTYPFSRGHVHITGPRPTDSLDFDTGFFADKKGIDLKKHRWAYKKQREVARRMSLFRGELSSGHPPFPASSKAACIAPDGPLVEVQDIEYSAEDDSIIDEWARDHVSSAWHSLGTCKMAPRDEYGVVDQCLSVYGVEGLKIADLSIIPKTVAANTNNTALAVGEKAASIFIQELGLGRQ
ncbi:alcohol oxidase [Hypoxylon trugodes]|uniref:alcohol oxidase n=1 Tax=Hypoxylon trugodes TaxID=326681 RepID=UPI00218D9A4C|nr:alcohol oxidase [Hypoxylon trugodes]KAI1389497.1 alcohol oxidase [Hypoxylon trugodes]